MHIYFLLNFYLTCMYIHIYIYIYIHTYTCIYTYTYTHTYNHKHRNKHIYTYWKLFVICFVAISRFNPNKSKITGFHKTRNTRAGNSKK